MREVDRLEGELARAHRGNAWHGPSLEELTADVSAEQALRKPTPSAHSIWELVLHVTAWERAAIQALAGERIDLTAEEDWPPLVEGGESDWKAALQEMRDTNEKLRSAVSKLEDTRLEEIVVGKDYSISVMLHGVVQHSLYHGGQIALLRKG